MANLAVSKFADKRLILLNNIGNRIIYTIIVENLGEDPALNVMVKDTIENGTNFISGSVNVNGYNKLDADIRIGINIGNLNPGERIVIIYDVEVDTQIPSDSLSSSATITYEYCKAKEVITTDKFLINIVKLDVDVIKRANKNFVKLGDVITYYVNINNNSNIDIENVIFLDDIEPNFKLILSSFTVNGIYQSVKDLKKGVNIGKLNPKSSLVVSFQATAVLVPFAGRFSNQSQVDFSYIADDRLFKGTCFSNLINTNIGPTSFKQVILDNMLEIPSSKPGVKKILDHEVEIKVLSANVIKSIKATSCEGQRLTGYKALIKGIILEQVEYVATTETQPIYLEEFNIPFATSVVLDENYNESNLEINVEVEDVYSKCLSEKTLFNTITFMLQVIN